MREEGKDKDMWEGSSQTEQLHNTKNFNLKQTYRAETFWFIVAGLP